MFMFGKSSAAPSQNSRNIRAYVLALLIGLFFSGAALVMFALITWFFRLPIGQSELFASLAFAVGCLASGVFIGWVRRQNGLFKGAKSALFFILPILIVSFFMSGFTGELIFERVITAVICGAVGGVIGVNKKKH